MGFIRRIKFFKLIILIIKWFCERNRISLRLINILAIIIIPIYWNQLRYKTCLGDLYRIFMRSIKILRNRLKVWLRNRLRDRLSSSLRRRHRLRRMINNWRHHGIAPSWVKTVFFSFTHFLHLCFFILVLILIFITFLFVLVILFFFI